MEGASDVPLPVFSPSNPPCHICHGKGTGIHYGVNTCDACKGFFARCHIRKTAIKCKYKGHCEIINGYKQCSACRLKKCISLGMSKQASLVGRNSTAQRTKKTEEVKRLELQAKLKSNGALVSDSEYEQNMDALVTMLTNTTMQSIPNTAEDLENILGKEQQYLEEKAEEELLFGSRKPVSRKDNKEFYAHTGIELDNKRQQVLRLGARMQTSIDSFAQFASFIPGYEQLPKQDKLKLLKYSMVQVNLFNYSHLMNLDHGIQLHPYDPNMVINIEELLYYCDDQEEVSVLFNRLSQSIQQLDLTIEETCMCSALCVLIADVPNLSAFSRDVLDTGAEYVLEVLQRELAKNHEQEEHTLPKIILLITESRTFLESHLKSIQNFIADNYDLHLPANLLEILFADENQDT